MPNQEIFHFDAPVVEYATSESRSIDHEPEYDTWQGPLTVTGLGLDTLAARAVANEVARKMERMGGNPNSPTQGLSDLEFSYLFRAVLGGNK